MPFNDYPLHIVKTPGAITAAATGLVLSPTLDGQGLTSLDDVDGPWLRHRTQATPGAGGGLLTTLDVTAAQWRPKVEFVVRTAPESELARARYWIGLFDQRPDGLNVGSSGTRMAAFHFDGGATGESPWQVVVANGAAPAVAAFGGNVPGDTVHTLGVEVQAGQVVFSLSTGGPAQTQSVALVPGTSELLGLGVRVAATTVLSRSLRWQRVSWTPF